MKRYTEKRATRRQLFQKKTMDIVASHMKNGKFRKPNYRRKSR